MEKRIKTGGRKAGTPNQTTAETKELLQKVVSLELKKLKVLLEKLEPIERVSAISKLLPYILPKQSEIKTELKMDTGPTTSEERDSRIQELLKKRESK